MFRELLNHSSEGLRLLITPPCPPQLFRELLDHSSEGLRFYIGMGEVTHKCRQEAQDWAFTRQVQREELKQVGGCGGGGQKVVLKQVGKRKQREELKQVGEQGGGPVGDQGDEVKRVGEEREEVKQVALLVRVQ